MAMLAPKPLSASLQRMCTRIFRILVIPGDHVGPEIMKESLRVLHTVEATSQGSLKFELNHQLVGGCSIDRYGTPVTDEVLRIAKEESDAVLFGSVGGPEW
jgi:3-isopropylmalate dehydrogenase